MGTVEEPVQGRENRKTETQPLIMFHSTLYIRTGVTCVIHYALATKLRTILQEEEHMIHKNFHMIGGYAIRRLLKSK